MAAEATPIPENLLVAIRAAKEETHNIRAFIERQQGKLINHALSVEEFTEINAETIAQISYSERIIDKPRVTIINEGPWRRLHPDISREISSIPSSYTVVSGAFEQLGHDVKGANRLDMPPIIAIYRDMLAVLTTMEREWNALITEIEAMRAGPAMNNRGGYRKRKQRTQRKQKHRKTHRKQKHCKTHRK